MKRDIFTPADILLPEGIQMENWSVIACDQFSSERDYWERVRERVAGSPSTLNMIVPEAYLEGIDEIREIEKIRLAMDACFSSDVLREVKDSFIYVERTQTDGHVRRGLVGTIDLEDYSFSGGDAAILASEGTVLERLPARIRIRRAACLELPHIMTFIDDKNASVIEPLSAITDRLPLLYDFELMEGGGRIRGMQVTGGDAFAVMDAMRALHERNEVLMVIGDGNHSLASAKVYWDEIKESLSSSLRENHPARRALIEVNNVYDPAISFKAIHRIVFDVDHEELLSKFNNSIPPGDDYAVRWAAKDQHGEIGLSAGCIGDMLIKIQDFLDDYTSVADCRVDYIHGADTAKRLAGDDRCLALILPSMDKSELFETVARKGVFPKKSFSVGHARDKRYYLECRRI